MLHIRGKSPDPHRCLSLQGDLEDTKTVDNIANKVKGKVDILVNNAGMMNKESILQGVVTLEPRSCNKGKPLHGWYSATYCNRHYQTVCSSRQSELSTPPRYA